MYRDDLASVGSSNWSMTEQGYAPVVALGSKSSVRPGLEMEQGIRNAPGVHVEVHTFFLLVCIVMI